MAADKLTRLMNRIADLDEQEITKELFALIYGEKGVGKTTMAMGLAQKIRGDGRILFVDSSDGWVSLDKFPALKRNTDYISIPDPFDLMALAKGVESRKGRFKDVSVVVLDEGSSWFVDMLHAHVREATNTDADDMLPDFDWTYYGPPQAALLNVFKKFHKIPGLHVIVISHEQTRAVRGEKNAEKAMPAMGNQLTRGVGQLAHLVARVEARKVGKDYAREVQALPSRYVDAKSRLPLQAKLSDREFVAQVSEWTIGGSLSDTEVSEVAEDGLDDEDFEVSGDDDPNEG